MSIAATGPAAVTTAQRLVLVYPPYAAATSSPLGVCSLKGFASRRLPGWSVKVLDLNLLAHQEYLTSFAGQITQGGAQLHERALAGIALSRAAEVFLGRHDEEFYHRPDRYAVYADLWLQVFGAGMAAAVRQLEPIYRLERPMPQWLDHWAELVLRERPAVVGISICYSEQLWIGLALAKAIKRKAGIPVVLGGTFFNSGAGEFMAAHRGVIDYVVCGEGEKPLVELLSGGMNAGPVAGVSYVKDGQLVETAPVVVANLDELGEPDYSDLDLRAYYSPQPVLPIMTSRGCYWRRCAFCVHYRSAGLTYRQRSIAAVIAEIKGRLDQGVRHFSVIDEMISPARFSQLADGILAAGVQVFYYALAKPAREFDRPLLEKMYRSGCRYVMWGVESGSQRVLDLMDKGIQVGEVEAVLDAAAAAGLKNHVYLIFGFPTETRAELGATLDLLERHRKSIAMVHRGMFQLEQDSPVFEHPERFSIKRCWPATAPGLYEFECGGGMSRQETRQAFAQAVLNLRSFGTALPELGDFVFRDHALLRYCGGKGLGAPPVGGNI